MYIVNFKSNNDFNKDTVIEDLSKRYEAIALKIEDGICSSGDKKAKHTQFEMEFILSCSYKLIEIFNFKQEDLATVFGKPKAVDSADYLNKHMTAIMHLLRHNVKNSP